MSLEVMEKVALLAKVMCPTILIYTQSLTFSVNVTL